jgi:hypothetical protein
MQFTATASLLLAVTISSAHMEMKYPPPRGSQHNQLYHPIDYNNNAPLSSLVRACPLHIGSNLLSRKCVGGNHLAQLSRLLKLVNPYLYCFLDQLVMAE